MSDGCWGALNKDRRPVYWNGTNWQEEICPEFSLWSRDENYCPEPPTEGLTSKLQWWYESILPHNNNDRVDSNKIRLNAIEYLEIQISRVEEEIRILKGKKVALEEEVEELQELIPPAEYFCSYDGRPGYSMCSGCDGHYAGEWRCLKCVESKKGDCYTCM